MIIQVPHCRAIDASSTFRRWFCHLGQSKSQTLAGGLSRCVEWMGCGQILLFFSGEKRKKEKNKESQLNSQSTINSSVDSLPGYHENKIKQKKKKELLASNLTFCWELLRGKPWSAVRWPSSASVVGPESICYSHSGENRSFHFSAIIFAGSWASNTNLIYKIMKEYFD